MEMTISGPRLQAAGKGTGDLDCTYGLGMLMQISATCVLAQVNIRPNGVPIIDIEDGLDFFVFDSVANLGRSRPHIGFRNHFGEDPATGRDIFYVKYPSGGGFVPLGAKLADGRPHPHTGTGFALSKVLGFEAPAPGRMPDHRTRIWSGWELLQLSFDGATLALGRRELLVDQELLAGPMVIQRQPLSCAVGDGDDLLLPMSGGEANCAYGVGIARWCRGDSGWRPRQFHRVTPADLSYEPSLQRDRDQTLLLAVRGYGCNDPSSVQLLENHDTREAHRLYLRISGDVWNETICAHGRRANSPVMLNMTTDGTPFLAGNMLRPTHINRNGRTWKSSWMRENVFAWPLSDRREQLLKPYSLLDACDVFGPARDGLHRVNFWYVDHPIGGNFRLADGRWHCLIGLRVCEMAEVFVGAEPTPHSGYWLEELTTANAGAPLPTWSF